MEEYLPNSHKYKEEKSKNDIVKKKKIEKAISGTVKTKKKSEFRKFLDVFVPEDVESVKDYIIMDVVVPSIKKAISDTVDTVLFGETRSAPSKSGAASKVSYRSFYDKKNDDRHERYSGSRMRSGYDYEDIIFDSRGEAEQVLMLMDEIVSEYSMVRVADLYDLVGISSSFTDNNYGWTNIKNASVNRTRDGGYILKMPKVLPLD